jgi:hypothetical protein
MRPVMFVRGAAVLAVLAASFISLPSFPSVGLFTENPIAVDRTLKGDRLPRRDGANNVETPKIETPARQTREKVPLGCDGAFSPISSPRLANVFRRCTV